MTSRATRVSRALPSNVTVEYDGRGGRDSRTFPTYTAARRFYLDKSRQGRNPRVVSATR